jgi:hypothetical protein
LNVAAAPIERQRQFCKIESTMISILKNSSTIIPAFLPNQKHHQKNSYNTFIPLQSVCKVLKPPVLAKSPKLKDFGILLP